MSFKEQIEKISGPEKRDEFTEKALRSTEAPGCAGLTWGDVYDDAAREYDLLPGEDIFAFVDRMKKAQENEEPERPARRAA